MLLFFTSSTLSRLLLRLLEHRLDRSGLRLFLDLLPLRSALVLRLFLMSRPNWSLGGLLLLLLLLALLRTGLLLLARLLPGLLLLLLLLALLLAGLLARLLLGLLLLLLLLPYLRREAP